MTMATFTPLPIKPEKLRHISISASAGSGKTYKLASRYLQLIGTRVEPHRILASTFTRLAAGEIRDRILKRLAEAITNSKKREELQSELGVPSLPIETLTGMLAFLARRMDQMQIRTLDSFFAAVAQAFAVELDLPIGGEIINDVQDKQIRAEAVRLMLDERDPQTLVDLVRRITQGLPKTSVADAIDQAIDNWYALFQEAEDDAAWEVMDQRAPLSQEELHVAIDRVLHTVPTIKGHAKPIPDDCRRAREGDWAAFIGTGLPKAILGDGTFSGKKVETSVRAAYAPLIEHASAMLLNRVRERTMATRELLKSYDHHYRAIKHRMRALNFYDLTIAMIKARALDINEEIAYRLDATLQHVLLDEFQDTSIPQWNALERLLQEVTSHAWPERTFFCVGDVKQSIYGWRSAAPEILDNLKSLLHGNVEEDSLTTSYRSAPEVIESINRVFEELNGNAAIESYLDAVELWQQGFKRHTTTKDKLNGYVELRTMRTATEHEDATQIRLEQAARMAVEINQKNPTLSIGILTRKNDSVARIMYELSASRLNIPGGASGRGGSKLNDVPAVNVILDVLQLADYPDDSAAAFNIANSPLGRALGLQHHAEKHVCHRLAREIRHKLMEDGYAATISEWIATIADSCEPRELRRCMQLVELAAQFDQNRTLRPGDFINVVENTDVADVRPAPVQVMTIHKSKGLEFDVVILPDLECDLTGSMTPQVVYARAEPTGPITEICIYLNETRRNLCPEVQEIFHHHEVRTVRESLSVLYVAMTRARMGLYMLIDTPERTKSGDWRKDCQFTQAGVLRCALNSNEGDPQPDQLLYQTGSADWMLDVKGENEAAITAAPVRVDIKLKPAEPGTLPRGMAAASASQLAEHVGDSLAAALRLPNSESRQRGVALHLLLQQIEWIDSFTPSCDQLMALLKSKFPRANDEWRSARIDEFQSMLSEATLRSALAGAGKDTRLFTVYRERPFVRQLSSGVQLGAIDRLVVQFNQSGTAVAATILDFKTDGVDSSKAQPHAQRYLPQLRTYREAAAAMFGLSESRIGMQLLFVKPGSCQLVVVE